MKATKFFLIVACGIGLTHVKAEIVQPPVPQQSTDVFIVNMWVNGVDYHTETVTFSEGAKRYVECEALYNIGFHIEKLQRHAKKREFCWLNQSGITVDDDHSLQAIKIFVPVDYFVGTDYEQEVEHPEKANFGGFVNYSVFYGKNTTTTDDQEFNTFSEIGIFKDYWLFKNAFLYRNESEEFEDQQKFLRVSSSLDVEFPEHYLRLTFGDTTSPYSLLNNSFRFGGLSFGTNYIDRPDFVYWNIPSLTGSASLPSTIDLFINGVSLYRDSVTPGNYNLPAGAILNQAGTAQIVVEDILGNRTVRSFPVFINSRLLKPKLNEYNISFGKLRYNYDYVDDDYRDFFGKLYFRRGVTASTTLGMDLLYSKDVGNLDLSWTQGISKYFLLDTVFSVSQADEEEEQGYAGALGISRTSRNWSFGLNGRYFTPEYQYLSTDTYDSELESSSILYFNFSNLKIVDSLGFNFIYQSYHEDENGIAREDRRYFDVRASKGLTRNLYTDFGYYKEFSEDDEDQGFNIALHYNWGDKGRISLDHDTGLNETGLSFTHRTMAQNGFDYVLGVNQEDGEINYNAYGLLKTSIGNLQVSHDEYEDRRNTQATFEGALVWLGSKVALTKYADNAFALVDLDKHRDIDIYRSGTRIGSTNKNGYMFVHNIIPYFHHDISFDHNQLAMDETFEQSSKSLVGLDQRGYRLDFPIHRTKRIAVRLKDIQQNNLHAGAEVVVDGLGEEPSFVDSQGIVYLYLFKAGVYNLKVKTQGGQQCQAQFNLNETQFRNAGKQIIEAVCK